MEKEFIPYEQALALKKLGFDEPCIKGFYEKGEIFTTVSTPVDFNNKKQLGELLSVPLYQQAFRWFREKYNAHHEIVLNKDRDLPYTYVVDVFTSYLRSPFHKTYAEAELECLKKLIKLCEQ
jgi:hypothetical protein